MQDETSIRIHKSQRAPEFDDTCIGVNGFSCGWCGAVIMCAGGKAYVQPCHLGTSCTTHPAFEGSVCHINGDERCLCRGESEEIKPDPYDPGAFLLCQMQKSHPIVGFCADGEEYDAETLMCRARPRFDTCNHVGVFVNRQNCRWYQICVPFGNDGYRSRYLRCENSNHVYSEILRQCEDPKLLPSADPCAELPKKLRYTCPFWVILLAQLYPPAYEKFCEITQLYT